MLVSRHGYILIYQRLGPKLEISSRLKFFLNRTSIGQSSSIWGKFDVHDFSSTLEWWKHSYKFTNVHKCTLCTIERYNYQSDRSLKLNLTKLLEIWNGAFVEIGIIFRKMYSFYSSVIPLSIYIFIYLSIIYSLALFWNRIIYIYIYSIYLLSFTILRINKYVTI